MDEGTTYRFWASADYGLIRQRSGLDWMAHPEIWRNGHWISGSSYVMDAITGMGEDAHSCGEVADEISVRDAEKTASRDGIDLYAPNSDDPRS